MVCLLDMDSMFLVHEWFVYGGGSVMHTSTSSSGIKGNPRGRGGKGGPGIALVGVSIVKGSLTAAFQAADLG